MTMMKKSLHLRLLLEYTTTTHQQKLFFLSHLLPIIKPYNFSRVCGTPNAYSRKSNEVKVKMI